MSKELLFSLSKDKGDFVIETFRSGGKGGQNQNKVSSGVRVRHPASGAVGESREERSQLQNKKIAFRRLVETDKFKAWHKLKTAYAIQGVKDFEKEIDSRVSKQMEDCNLLVEYYNPDSKRWEILNEVLDPGVDQ